MEQSIVNSLPDTIRVVAAYPHGAKRGTAASWSADAPLPTDGIDALTDTLIGTGYRLASSTWSSAADRRVRFSRDITLPRSRRLVFQRIGTTAPTTLPAEQIVPGDVLADGREVRGARRGSTGGYALHFADFTGVTVFSDVEVRRPLVTDGASVGEPLLVTPDEMLPGDVYFHAGRRVTYLGDELGEIEFNGNVGRDQLLARQYADVFLVYRKAQPDTAALSRSLKAAYRAVAVADHAADEDVIERAVVTGATL